MALTQCFKVSVTLNPSAESRQRVMNTWHFATVDSTTPNAAFDAATSALNTFYQSIDAYLANEMNGLQPQMLGWNYLEPKPRQPFDEFIGTALSTGAGRSARETAVVLSYRAEYVSGVTPKRRRGRIYLGPMYGAVMDTDTGRVNSTLVTAVSNAADVLVTASLASSTWRWVVYSPTTDVAGTGETGFYEVIGGWVDNLPDTQRRRGDSSGSRTSWS